MGEEMTNLISKELFLELAKLDPNDVCKRVSCQFEAADNCYSLVVWDVTYKIYPDKCEIICTDEPRSLHEYFELFAIHYLLTAQDAAVCNEWISEKDLSGGVTFFRGPHEIPTKLIAAKAEKSLDEFRELCLMHSGTPLKMADTAFMFHITDRVPVAVLYWAGDDEFPSESKILYDKTLQHHFALDIVFALAVGICEELGKE